MSSSSKLARLTSSELKKMLAWKCPLKGHRGHNGIEHHTCYERIHGLQAEEKICYFDIETEDLNADYGIMFNWCILDGQNGKIYRDMINEQDIKKLASKDRNIQPKEDTRIIQNVMEKLATYDRIVTHYGARFDLPFLRTRAMICDVPFYQYGSIFQTDTWMILKHRTKLSRNSLETGCRVLVGASRKDHLSLSIKHGCLRGEKWALNLSDKHCEQDVLDLRDLHHKLEGSYKVTKSCG